MDRKRKNMKLEEIGRAKAKEAEAKEAEAKEAEAKTQSLSGLKGQKAMDLDLVEGKAIEKERAKAAIKRCSCRT